MQTIGKAAALSGVNIETIRYYEREGIVPAADRSASGRRLYDKASIARLRFIRRCRDLGFPLGDIRALLDLSTNTTNNCADVRAISARHLENVKARLADLRELDRALTVLTKACDSGGDDCPTLRILFSE